MAHTQPEDVDSPRISPILGFGFEKISSIWLGFSLVHRGLLDVLMLRATLCPDQNPIAYLGG